MYYCRLDCCTLSCLDHVQDDAAARQKQKEDQKKLKEAQARASQKGPMGESIALCCLYIIFIVLALSCVLSTSLPPHMFHVQVSVGSRRVARNDLPHSTTHSTYTRSPTVSTTYTHTANLMTTFYTRTVVKF